uniref:G-protein coupled receptors family 1 profile domain-containing protein n=1 Tax=Anopheles maculatus TaxID=74869 RepID=A0A182SX34_9DIPT
MDNLTAELSNFTASPPTDGFVGPVTAGQLAGAVMSTLLVQLVTAATSSSRTLAPTTTDDRDHYYDPKSTTPADVAPPAGLEGPNGTEPNLWFVTSLALSSRSQQHQQQQQQQQQQQHQQQQLHHSTTGSSGSGGDSSGGGGAGEVSPVTLSTEWPRLARLLLLACLSVVGSIGNVFMISSVMIEDHLKKAVHQLIPVSHDFQLGYYFYSDYFGHP